METSYVNNDLAILDRIVAAEEPDLPPEIARGYLRLSFHDDDRQRMNALAEKTSLGTRTAEEQAEMDSYERVGHFLSLLKSKARRSLRYGSPQA